MLSYPRPWAFRQQVLPDFPDRQAWIDVLDTISQPEATSNLRRARKKPM